MAISYAELKTMLDVDEPDYMALVEKAAGAMQHLRKLAESPDVSLASKAVSLAGMMGEADSIGIIGNASKSRAVLIRVAAAHAATMLPDSPQTARVVSKLLDDRDVGVVKLAALAATRLSDPRMATKAKRASKRMEAAVRAMTVQKVRRERNTAMTNQAGMKTRGSTTRAQATHKGSTKASGQMPTGAMTQPPKGTKARGMPTGKMK
ncbi:MAG: HEAT repeat domain-containing protein [Nitrospira sp.]|nr:HEAT repeat domain-containing protein [Nitrospira sp.]